jgi:hypothetical protein
MEKYNVYCEGYNPTARWRNSIGLANEFDKELAVYL